MMEQLSTQFIAIIFVLCAFAILIAGRFLIIFADVLADRTKFGHALVGTLFLAFITSLPEIVATVTAMQLNNPSLAVNNLIGGILMQTFIVALADWFCARKPITCYRIAPIVIVMALFLVLQLAVCAVGFTVGEFFKVRGFGLWPIIVVLLYFSIFIFIHKMPGADDTLQLSPRGQMHREWVRKSNPWMFAFSFFFFAAVVLIAGSLVTASVDEIGKRTGVNSGFLGATLLAFVTSLPEVSTTFYAIRVGGATLAFSNIFGSNMLMLALLFLADMLSPTSIFNQLKIQPVLLAAMAMIATVCYALGMIIKGQRKWFGMGVDSFFVVITALAGFVLLYFYK